MSYSKIRPRGDLKANWESANPILSAREIGVEWETKIGVGDAKIKFGDGATAWKNLDYAVVNNITKKIITTFATVSDADPALNAGESLDTILGKIKKKFQYLADNKLNKSSKYDGVDSTSTDLYATANAVRKVNVKADKNASDITTLNNNLSKALLSSDLFMNNWIINPNTCNKPFAIVNGWSANLANVPDDAKNTWNSLQTIWTYPADIGDLTKVRLQTLITGNNAIHVRMYENGKFENWS